ncbi:putative methyltransferase [Steroidobacter denitrificans]|uniref:Putative methyltransferase n=1 Tax=Steroidobacter denitrificans TaxID=465721 RepID=A0A127F7L7_STEDE|nr:class I SAM-dependent methyltransferase [Steroidobacter denitrificans]AMN46433.1 putative methyltransferase [Steroidobacter denitrificans]
METNYAEVTEIAGEPITAEQLFRLNHRYAWAVGYCGGRDVVECGCGTGPGLGLLQGASRTFEAGDISPLMVEVARRHYGSRVRVSQFNAETLPFASASKDVVLLFEAIYYLPDASRFVRECRRVLRPGGYMLIVTANKDLWDFHPSPHAYRYYGVLELSELFAEYGFECEFFGFQDVRRTGWRQRLLRPVKRFVVAIGLMPKTMAGKRWIKRIVFGPSLSMPAELSPGYSLELLERIDAGCQNEHHKIIYCAARL